MGDRQRHPSQTVALTAPELASCATETAVNPLATVIDTESGDFQSTTTDQQPLKEVADAAPVQPACSSETEPPNCRFSTYKYASVFCGFAE